MAAAAPISSWAVPEWPRSGPGPFQHLLECWRCVPRCIHLKVWPTDWLPGRSHTGVNVDTRIGPGLRIHPIPTTHQPSADHLGRRGHHDDGQRNVVPAGDGDHWPAVSLRQVGRVQHHRIPLADELVDQAMAGAKHPAVLVSRIFRLPDQCFSQTIRFQHQERLARHDLAGKSGFAGAWQTSQHQKTGIAWPQARLAYVRHQQGAQAGDVVAQAGSRRAFLHTGRRRQRLGAVREPAGALVTLSGNTQTIISIGLRLEDGWRQQENQGGEYHQPDRNKSQVHWQRQGRNDDQD